MLKRKLYWVAMGLIVSHISMAKFLNGNSPQSFGRGDCTECGAPAKLDFPLAKDSKIESIVSNIQSNLGKSVTGFTHGNSVNGALDAQAAAKLANSAVSAQVAPPAPFVVPGPMRLVPTQAEYERLMPATWLDAIRSKTYYDPWSGPQQIVPTSAAYFNGALPYWGNPYTLIL